MVYIYCRISSSAQDQGVSLETQESSLTTLCKQLGWKITNVQKVVSSAYKKISDGLDKYKELSNKKILIFSVDRFSRNVEQGKEFIKKLIDNKNTIYFLKEKLSINNYNSDKWNKFIECLVLAENESRLLGERVMLGKRKAREMGRFCGGRTPYGYKKIKTVQDGYSRLVPDVSVEAIIKFIIGARTPGLKISTLNKLLSDCGANVEGEERLIFEYGSEFKIDDGLSYGTIANILNDYKISGKKWNTTVVKNIYTRFNEFIKVSIIPDIDIVQANFPNGQIDLENLNKKLTEEKFFD